MFYVNLGVGEVLSIGNGAVLSFDVGSVTIPCRLEMKGLLLILQMTLIQKKL